MIKFVIIIILFFSLSYEIVGNGLEKGIYGLPKLIPN